MLQCDDGRQPREGGLTLCVKEVSQTLLSEENIKGETGS